MRIFQITALLFASGCACAALAQSPLTFSGEMRARAEVRDNADFNSDRLDGTAQVFQRVRFGMSRAFEHNLRVFVQMQDSRIWGEEGASLNALNNIDLHQAYLEITRFGNLPLELRLGRQTLAFGSERLVGEYDWHNVGRAFDALQLRCGNAPTQLNVWLAQVRDHTAPLVARNQEFAGAYFSAQQLLPFAIDAYWLLLYDARNFESVANPATPGRQDEPSYDLTMHTLGLRVSRAAGQRLQFDGEGAYQFGGRGFQDIHAYAFALEARYALAQNWRPTLRFGYVLGSGDKQANDGKNETFSSLFPNAHAFLGAMDYASWSNIAAPCLGFALMPRPNLTIGADYYWLNLQNDNDAWYRAGGFTIGTPQEFYRKAVPGVGKRVGQEFDVHCTTTYRERIAVQFGASKFFVGEFTKNTGGLRADDSFWGYLSLQAKF